MRRLSIPLTCLFLLLPGLGLGCAAKSGEAQTSTGSDYVKAEDAPAATAPVGEAPSAPPAEAVGGGEAEPSDAMGPGMVADGEAAAAPPATAAAPSRTRGAMDSAAPLAGSADKAEGRSAKGGARPMKKSSGEEAKIARDDADFAHSIQSGTLTAGSFDDNLNPWAFDRFVAQAKRQPGLASLAAAFAGQRTVLRVQDAQGRPVGGARVDIDGKTMTTRSDGRVVWVDGWDSGRQGQGRAKVRHGRASATLKLSSQLEQIVTLADTQGTLPSRLDLALVVDATGSMGDELEYLKVELRDIASVVAKHFPGVDQRYALIVYRDSGDAYETRVFDFTGNLAAFHADLGKQSAGGGGDYPEAMDKALQAATQLSWRGDDTARVTFLVADAPPHAGRVDDTLEAVDGLRAQGVAVYPVASSGVGGEAEFVMRSAALLTGAQYLFLTDDSGVGNPHAEPHIPCYSVEQLAPLMTRVIRSELAGERVEADERRVIRSVGRGQGGVCEQPSRRPGKVAR